jgi:hypothetical protein
MSDPEFQVRVRTLLQRRAERLIRFLDIEAPANALAVEASLIWKAAMALECPEATETMVSALVAQSKAALGVCAEAGCTNMVIPREVFVARAKAGELTRLYNPLLCEWCNVTTNELDEEELKALQGDST